MHEIIEAIYENGVLRPLAPLAIREHARVQVQVLQGGDAANDRVLTAQQAAISELLTEFAGLHQPPSNDAFSGSEHDAVLYGRPA